MTSGQYTKKSKWALILGGSSGLGLATARKLGAHGFNLIVVHRDRRSDLEVIESHFREIGLSGTLVKGFNMDATNADKRRETIAALDELLPENEKIHILVHSLAKGSLKPMFAKEGSTLDHQDFTLTLNAMALSLYDWTKALWVSGLFSEDTRIVSFTSEGNTKAWPGYAAVSAAKVTLEAISRNIALEFAQVGIKSNCIQAGVVDTKSFAMIPGYETLKQSALERNPNKRLTTTEDVADVVYLLTTEEARWITGTVIKVDGGESLR